MPSLEAKSYEDWMNDVATDDSRMPPGWQARYQTRCDRCGRFGQQGTSGSSWVMVPGTDWNAEDDRYRCPTCTKKVGPCRCGPGYVASVCEGVSP